MPRRPPGSPRGDQRWSTFVRNHAQAIVAYDSCIAVTATFRVLYIWVVMEHGTRRVLHCNVTAHPTAAWASQQLREAFPFKHEYRFLIHAPDSIFAKALNATNRNLRRLPRSWVKHYNSGRPHMSLGLGVPDPPPATSVRLQSAPNHQVADGFHVTSRAILSGLHHEYSLMAHGGRRRSVYLRTTCGLQVCYERYLKANTEKKRTHSLFRQGLMINELMPNMDESWLTRIP